MAGVRLKHRIVVDVLFDHPITDIEAARCLRSILKDHPMSFHTRNRSLSITDAKSFIKVHEAEKLKKR